jgi:hypothetical protein
MDNVLVVVDDLAAAKAFFLELGMELEGETCAQWLGSRRSTSSWCRRASARCQ